MLGGQAVARNIEGLAPCIYVKTVPIIGLIIGTTLAYISCRLIDSVHVHKKFCAVGPYLRN